MPIYEYECQACGHRFEEWQKMADEPIKVCPKCKKRKVEKLISHTSFQLKGGGWYSDLYASQKPGKSSPESSSDGKAESASKAESAGKAESASGGSSSGSSSTTTSTTTTSESKGKGKKGASKAAA